jgi:hypothetical protein
MPDVHSIGLGGGSRVRVLDNGHVTVGPDSVGHYVRCGARCLLISKLIYSYLANPGLSRLWRYTTYSH